MSSHMVHIHRYSSTLVIKPSRTKVALAVALLGLIAIGPMVAIFKPGLDPLALIVLVFLLSLLVLVYLGLLRQEVWLSTSVLTVHSVLGKRVISGRDLRYMQMGMFRILNVVYQGEGRVRKSRIRCSLMSYRDEHRLISAIQESWPGLLTR